MKNTLSNEIIICNCCQGSGKILERTSAYDSERVVCTKCNGSGRLVKLVEVTIKPYTND